MVVIPEEKELNIWKIHQLEAEINKDMTENIDSFSPQHESGFTEIRV